jgi:hypothetical protein
MRPRHQQSRRLLLEALETRLMPASVFVVPVTQVADATHLHTLADAITAAGSGGVVTIEPGVSPDPTQPVTVTRDGITIQGDPNVPASILPAEQIVVQASRVTLTNLNIASLLLGDGLFDNPGPVTSSFNNVTRCLINSLSSLDAQSTYSQNVLSGRCFFERDGQTGGEIIANNTFEAGLGLTGVMGSIIIGNTFHGQSAITLHDCGSLVGAPTTIAGNTILLLDVSGGSPGISVVQESLVSDVKILNNAITVGPNDAALYLFFQFGNDDHFRAYVEGNDFHNAAIGVSIRGNGSSCGTIDLGGGALGSKGGNNFRSFTTIGTTEAAAILLTNTAETAVVSAAGNIFHSGVSPASVVDDGVEGRATGTGQINAEAKLDDAHAFVQTLYNNLLGRTGALAELDPWVQLLNSQGQAAVSNAILHSPEALGRIVDSFYLRFLGRQSDATGRAGWISFLQNGGTEEQVETQFLTSPEYISHIDTDFVQSLYLNILGRPGSLAELAGWNNNIQNLGGLAGVANDFVHSPENRLNTLRADFQTFLHRTPADSEITALANSTQDLLSLEGLVLSSPEFFANG